MYPRSGLMMYCARYPTPIGTGFFMHCHTPHPVSFLRLPLWLDLHRALMGILVLSAMIDETYTCLKSSSVSVRPIDSIRNPRPYVNRSLLNHSRDDGREIPKAAPKQTCQYIKHYLKCLPATDLSNMQLFRLQGHNQTSCYPCKCSIPHQ